MKFRRIHGHIVPIKEPSDKNTIAKGAAVAATGGTIAAGAGHYASRMVHDAAKAENAARDVSKAAQKSHLFTRGTGPLFEKAADTAFARGNRSAALSRLKSEKLFKAAMNIRKAGAVAGAGLIAAGVNQSLEGTRFQKDKKTRAAVATGAGVAAHFAIKSAYLQGLHGKLPQALKGAAKSIILKRFGK